MFPLFNKSEYKLARKSVCWKTKMVSRVKANSQNIKKIIKNLIKTVNPTMSKIMNVIHTWW